MIRLSDSEIRFALHELPGWQFVDNKLVSRFDFASFALSIAFVNRVAAAAEAQNHHPDIDVRYDKVTLGLSTHDSGGVTKRDFRLAATIQALRVQTAI